MLLVKADFPRLLEPGFHPMTLAEVKTLCVTNFPASTRRGMIFAGLTGFLSEMSATGLVGDVWLDGSFVTRKPDPSDCDLVISADSAKLEALLPTQQELIRKRVRTGHDQTKIVHHCDVYLFPVYPLIHTLHVPVTLSQRAYWEDQFGFDHSKHAKGMAVVKLPVTP